MRFYAIKIDGAPAKQFPPVPGAPVAGAQFCSVANVGNGMVNDPGALRCVMRIEMMGSAAATANSFVRLYGVDIEMLKQASNLNGLPIQIYAGFWPGLPLATEEAPYAGALYCGTIHMAFGNWQDEDMTLDFLIMPGDATSAGSGSSNPQDTKSSDAGGGSFGGGAPTPTRLLRRQRNVGVLPTPGRRRIGVQPLEGDGGGGGLSGIISGVESAISTLASTFGAGSGWGSMPANLIHDWQPGELMSNAIRKTLTKAFPWCTIDINIASLLTNPGAHDSGFYSSLEQFAGFAKQTSLSLMSGTNGVVGTMSSVIGGMAAASGNSDMQALAKAVASAAGNSKSSDNYPGIHTFIKCQRIIVTDYTSPEKGPTLKFEELIGQPTWLQTDTITFRVPMRADIYPPLIVTLPPDTLEFVERNWQQTAGEVHTLAVNFANQPIGLTQVTAIGDSRHPDGGSWALTCVGNIANAALANAAQPATNDQGTPNLGGGVSQSPQRLLRRPVRRYAR